MQKPKIKKGTAGGRKKKSDSKAIIIGGLTFIGLIIFGALIGGIIVHETDWNTRDAAIKIVKVSTGEVVVDGSFSPQSAFFFDDYKLWIYDLQN